MASLLPSSLPSIPTLSAPVVAGLLAVGVFATMLMFLANSDHKFESPAISTVQTYAKFAWNCFIKPHTGSKNGTQQDALESFYKSQASIYDATRSRLLRGREDMLGLVGAQMRSRVDAGTVSSKPIWVDVSSGISSGRRALLTLDRLVVVLDTTSKP